MEIKRCCQVMVVNEKNITKGKERKIISYSKEHS